MLQLQSQSLLILKFHPFIEPQSMQDSCYRHLKKMRAWLWKAAFCIIKFNWYGKQYTVYIFIWFVTVFCSNPFPLLIIYAPFYIEQPASYYLQLKLIFSWCDLPISWTFTGKKLQNFCMNSTFCFTNKIMLILNLHSLSSVSYCTSSLQKVQKMYCVITHFSSSLKCLGKICLIFPWGCKF